MSFKNKNVIAIIPAKKNSSRLKNKNLKKIKGSRLFEIAIYNSFKCKYIDQVHVSSDSNFILTSSKKLGAQILKRPKNLCQINTNANKVILHFIRKLPTKIKKTNPYILYLQPTSPLRNFKHLNKAFEILKKSNKTNLVSVYKSKKNLLKSLILKNEKITPLFPNYYNENDQNLPNLYKQNGAIYIFLLKNFLKKNKIPINNLLPYIMNEKDSIDINDIEDLKKIKNY